MHIHTPDTVLRPENHSRLFNTNHLINHCLQCHAHIDGIWTFDTFYTHNMTDVSINLSKEIITLKAAKDRNIKMSSGLEIARK